MFKTKNVKHHKKSQKNFEYHWTTGVDLRTPSQKDNHNFKIWTRIQNYTILKNMMVTPLISLLKYYINENFMNMTIFEPKIAEIDQFLSQKWSKKPQMFKNYK